MLVLLQQRCFNHVIREAAVCCPECKRFFCRECVTEHAGRMLCAACLIRASRSKTEKTRARLRVVVLRPAQLAISFFLLWLVFYSVGQGLLRIPDMFHPEHVSSSAELEDAE